MHAFANVYSFSIEHCSEKRAHIFEGIRVLKEGENLNFCRACSGEPVAGSGAPGEREKVNRSVEVGHLVPRTGRGTYQGEGAKGLTLLMCLCRHFVNAGSEVTLVSHARSEVTLVSSCVG